MANDTSTEEQHTPTSDQDGDRTTCSQCGGCVSPEGDTITEGEFQLAVRNERNYGPESLTYTFCSQDCLKSFCDREEPVQPSQESKPDPLDENGEGLIFALESAGCHPDIIQYVHLCRKNNELTGLLSTMHTFHRGGEGNIERLSKIGTKKEKILWCDGAKTALEQVGNWDTTNKPMLEEISRTTTHGK